MKSNFSKYKMQNRYLDLMEKILVNSIYEDSSIHPGSDNTYVAKNRTEGRDWPLYAHTMVGAARLKNLRELVEQTLEQKIPGDYIETGVWRGGCCIMMKAVLSAYSDPTRKVFVADSFEGLPQPKPALFPADTGDNLHEYSELSISLEQVRSNFAKYELLDSRVIFVKGFFDVTLPSLQADTFALLRLDGDMYESTIVALNNLYPKLSPGGFVIIDDYALGGCQKAVDDYRAQYRINAKINKVDWTGIWWQKPIKAKK